MNKEIKIPDIAENVESGTIASVLVAKGDKVSADQSLVEIETDKASTDIPSPFAGTVVEVKVSEGDEVKVNQVIMIIDTEEEGKEDEDQEEKEAPEEEAPPEEKDPEKGEEKKENEEKRGEEQKEQEEPEKQASQEQKDLSDIPASPSVRRLAREMDVDLTRVKGSGPGNRIVAEDVKNFSKEEERQEAPKTSLPDFSQWGPVSAQPMSNIRKITARNVQQAWQSIPHVTQFDEADMTSLENFRKKQQEKTGKEGPKLTVTALLLKITGFALQKFPRFNASLDPGNEKISYKHYYHIGVAVDTPQGLLVPVIRDVNTKSLQEISSELAELSQKARNKKISPEEMQGGTFTISNLGGIGGTGFTPIVYSPQVAILGVSRSAFRLVPEGDEFEKRLVLPLSLSYDHRIIDGADGARFLRWICNVIENPYAMLE